jgi:excisionase family DNA binding protein
MGANQFPPFAPERLYKVEEAAEYLRVGDRTVYKFIAEGRLIASWIGRSHMITQTNLVAFVKGAEQAHSKPTSPEIQ